MTFCKVEMRAIFGDIDKAIRTKPFLGEYGKTIQPPRLSYR